MTAKHAENLLNDIYLQRGQRHTKVYKPKLRIWMHSVDIETIIMERRDLFLDQEYGRSRYPTHIFGIPLIVTDDQPVGAPYVEDYSQERYG